MEISNTSPQTAPESVECTKCHQRVAPEKGQVTKSGFICNNCIVKAKKKKKILLGVILACLLGGAVSGYFMVIKSNRTVSGFDGVTEINDSVKVEMEAINVEFNLATATLSSTPVSTQSPINNIDDFKRVIAHNVEDAKNGKTNSLEVPVSSVKFNFNSASLNSDALALTKEIASFYNKTSKNDQIEVSGYACNIGEDAPNNAISEQRAEVVKSALVDNGINPSNISVKWYGKSKNAEFNLPDNADNRRVLISIIKK